MHTFRLGFCAATLALSVIAVAEQSAGEYQVKAAYLYDFAKMTHWTAQRLPDGAVLIIGVYGGDDDFPNVLRNILAGKMINGHPLEIRRLRSPQDVKFCHEVFFRASERTPRSVIEELGKSGVLLVGEDKNFLAEGGMINLSLEDGKISSQANAAAIERGGMRSGDASSARAQPGATDLEPESSRSIVFRVTPQYPRIAASLNLVGAVQIKAVVRADGSVRQVRVVGGHPVLAEAAAGAVMRWRYEAGPRETTESVKVSFGE